MDIKYDGEPKFEPIDGTTMSYAVNTETPVVKLKEKYYACDSGAWYESASPKGKWNVCDKVPDEIYTIPPSCPIYNSTFVKVYEADEDSVDVGYTSGYTGSYDDDGVIVYGTGYCYRPWIGLGLIWCMRPHTWGCYYRYNHIYARWRRYDRYRDRLGRYIAWNRREPRSLARNPALRPPRAPDYYRGAALASVGAGPKIFMRFN